MHTWGEQKEYVINLQKENGIAYKFKHHRDRRHRAFDDELQFRNQKPRDRYSNEFFSRRFRFTVWLNLRFRKTRQRRDEDEDDTGTGKRRGIAMKKREKERKKGRANGASF